MQLPSTVPTEGVWLQAHADADCELARSVEDARFAFLCAPESKLAEAREELERALRRLTTHLFGGPPKRA